MNLEDYFARLRRMAAQEAARNKKSNSLDNHLNDNR